MGDLTRSTAEGARAMIALDSRRRVLDDLGTAIVTLPEQQGRREFDMFWHGSCTVA